jgi:hypothetical protein
LDIPDDDHVMRHVPYNRLLKDEDGNVLGLLAHAFETRENEKDLSVNWLEHFKQIDYYQNVVATVHIYRATRNIKKKCHFSVGKVANILSTCKKHSASKVKVVHDRIDDNPSHSAIIRLPNNDLELMEALASEAFLDNIPNTQIP